MNSMKKAMKLALVGLFLVQAQVCAQQVQNSARQSPIRSFAATVGDDMFQVYTSPFRFKQSDGLKLVSVSSAAILLMTLLDEPINDNFIERDKLIVKPAIGMAKVGERYDRITSKYVLAGLAVPMLVGGLAFHDKKMLNTTRLLLESYFISGSITFVGKRLVGRARPLLKEGALDFTPFRFNAERDRRSFPSGHSTIAFAMMTVLAKQYPQPWVAIPAYSLGLSVALQRIESQQHWAADVFVGGAIGYWVGTALVNRTRQKHNNKPMTAYFMGNRAGIIVSF